MRQKSTGFKKGLREYIRGLFKQMRRNYWDGEFQKLRIEILARDKVRVAMTEKGKDKPSLSFSFSYLGTSKEDAAQWTREVIYPDILQPKSFDDFEIVDVEDPANSDKLRKVALNRTHIITNVRSTGVTTMSPVRCPNPECRHDFHQELKNGETSRVANCPKCGIEVLAETWEARIARETSFSA